jgi:cytochrome c oxidase accessory protein FixG
MTTPHDGPSLDRLHVINEDGSRNHVHPADVKGRFNTAKPVVYTVLILIYAALPWIKVGGNPAILIDIPARSFYLFGNTYNAQDFYLAFFLLTGVGFGLIVLSALWGRVWCGWACPQTVFLEAVFRRMERLIDGPRNKRLALQKAPWTASKIARRLFKHGVYLFLALLVSHIFISYFVSLPRLFDMVRQNPAENWTTFTWMAAITGVIYFNFSWFREQTCIVICPYGRLQSALQDDDTWIIGYDEKRGEPRGKAKDPNAGDCVDCKRCVVVCPTGIDIRNGLQMECIGCANCIDACDEVMEKLKRPRGLVRYDTKRGLTDGTRRFLRPRVFAYLFLGVLGLVVATVMFSRREAFEANVLRVQSAPYVVEGDTLRNQLMIHVVNKHPEKTTFHLKAPSGQDATFIIPQPRIELGRLRDHQVPVVVQVKTDTYKKGMVGKIEVRDALTNITRLVEFKILGPSRGNAK